jgi:hypothetical protein
MSAIKAALQREMQNLTSSIDDIIAMLSLTDEQKRALLSARHVLQGNAGGQSNGIPPASFAPSAPVSQSKPVNAGQSEKTDALMFFAFPNKGKKWEVSDEDYLKGLISSTALSFYDVVYASRHLGRTPYSIALKLVSLGYQDKEWASAFHDLSLVVQNYKED